MKVTISASLSRIAYGVEGRLSAAPGRPIDSWQGSFWSLSMTVHPLRRQKPLAQQRAAGLVFVYDGHTDALLARLTLDVESATGTVVSRTTDHSFAYPTSLDVANGKLLVVNSQFDRRGTGLTPVLPFTVSVIARP
jgi:hypothetical protein